MSHLSFTAGEEDKTSSSYLKIAFEALRSDAPFIFFSKSIQEQPKEVNLTLGALSLCTSLHNLFSSLRIPCVFYFNFPKRFKVFFEPSESSLTLSAAPLELESNPYLSVTVLQPYNGTLQGAHLACILDAFQEICPETWGLRVHDLSQWLDCRSSLADSIRLPDLLRFFDDMPEGMVFKESPFSNSLILVRQRRLYIRHYLDEIRRMLMQTEEMVSRMEAGNPEALVYKNLSQLYIQRFQEQGQNFQYLAQRPFLFVHFPFNDFGRFASRIRTFLHERDEREALHKRLFAVLSSLRLTHLDLS